MDIPPLGIVILLASAGMSFAAGRWLSRRSRDKKRARDRAEREAGQSRQVRRARERQARR